MTRIHTRRGRGGFWLKVALAAALVVAADQLFFIDALPGSILGGFGLAWALAAAIAHPQLRRPAAFGALAPAIGFAVVMIDHPTLLSWLLFGLALASAVLLPRVARIGDAWRWALRLAFQACAGAIRPALDLQRLLKLKRRGSRRGVLGWITLLFLPCAAARCSWASSP